MTKVNEVINVFRGIKSEGKLPVVPIYHTAAAGHKGVPLPEFSNSARAMADTAAWSYRSLGLDGVQLTLGVAVEAEAMGAQTLQPQNGLPAVTSHLLEDAANLKKLTVPDPAKSGRMPLFISAVEMAQKEIGEKCCVLATIRGPLNIASQLRGLNRLLLDIYDDPGFVQELLEFTNEVSYVFGKALIKTAGMPVLVIAEALCSTDCVSPDFYGSTMAPLHKKLIKKFHDDGLKAALLHICGNIVPIMPAIKETGADSIDVDMKADLEKVLETSGSMGMRGNLDPAWMLSATAGEVQKTVEKLTASVVKYPWVLSTGCDIPFGTPFENMKALCTR